MKNSNYILVNYFDIIGGTSTGVISASLLVLGKEVDKITQI